MQWFFDVLLKHLKLRLSVSLVKAELLSWRSLCKAGNALRGASLSNALWMGKHTVLEIFGKKHSSAGAVLKGTAGHNMWTINYSFASGFEGTPAITSHHDVTMKAPVWEKEYSSFSTSC